LVCREPSADPVRSFGPAGALFVALALSALEPKAALPPIITNLSLGVFCYMVAQLMVVFF
jgi:hypothetical protein